MTESEWIEFIRTELGPHLTEIGIARWRNKLKELDGEKVTK